MSVSRGTLTIDGGRDSHWHPELREDAWLT